MAGQIRGIGNTGGQRRGINTLSGTDDTHNLQVLTLRDHTFHIGLIAGHIFPDLIFSVVAIHGGNGNQFESKIHQILIGPLQRPLHFSILIPAHHLGNDIFENLRIF